MRHRHSWHRESMEYHGDWIEDQNGTRIPTGRGVTIAVYRCEECGEERIDRHDGDQRASFESAEHDSAIIAVEQE
jgi:hypothetical protein